MLGEYQPKPEAMFPGMRGVTERLTRFMADKILCDACKRIELERSAPICLGEQPSRRCQARGYL
jgi:hypothetical protein